MVKFLELLEKIMGEFFSKPIFVKQDVPFDKL